MFPLSISPSSLFICSAVSLSLYLSVFNLVQYSENLYEACVIYLIHTFVACLLIQFALSLSNEKILFSKNQPNRCCCLFTLNSTAHIQLKIVHSHRDWWWPWFYLSFSIRFDANKQSSNTHTAKAIYNLLYACRSLL